MLFALTVGVLLICKTATQIFNNNIHPLSRPLMLYRAAGVLEPIQSDTG